MTTLFFPKIQGWPLKASVLAGSFVSTLLHALMDPTMVVYTGWYVDALNDGPVWHRWLHKLEKDALTPHIGIAVLTALYGLATRSIVEFHRDTAQGPVNVKPGSRGIVAQDGVLETSIFGVVRGRESIPVVDLIKELVPAKLSRPKQEAWLRDKGIKLYGRDPDPAELVSGLYLAGLLVRIEAGLEILEQDHDSVENLLFEIEMAVDERLSTSR